MIKIEKWVASADQLRSLDSWVQWFLKNEKPHNEAQFEYIPKQLKRRCSSITKRAIDVALELIQGFESQIEFGIFSSQNGEIEVTNHLLSSILVKEPISPMQFSQSVHNNAAGLFTITAKNGMDIVSIGSGNKSLLNSIIRSYAYLKNHPTDKVLIIYYDQTLPKIYSEVDNQNSFNEVCLGLILNDTFESSSIANMDHLEISDKLKSIHDFDLFEVITKELALSKNGLALKFKL